MSARAVRSVIVDTFGAKAVALDALYSILNVEYVAQVGATNTSTPGEGLDVLYHFEKVRAAIRALEAQS